MIISGGHQTIQRDEITEDLLTGWKNPSIAVSQRKLTETQLRDMYAGRINELFTILAGCVGEYDTTHSSILEIGCSTGYYYEILKYLLDTEIRYTGVDYSHAMIEKARAFYPEACFVEADAANLPFEDRAFSIVISGSILIHNVNYVEHIKETARVADQRVIIHRTQLCKSRPTQFLKKKAYDVDVLEVRFNETELLGLFEKEGFTLIRTCEYLTETEKDEFEATHLLGRRELC